MKSLKKLLKKKSDHFTIKVRRVLEALTGDLVVFVIYILLVIFALIVWFISIGSK